jgi:PKD repeat protein
MTTASPVRSLTLLALLAATAASADVVIPSTVYRRGAGGAEFRSDVRVFNPTTSPINYTPVLYDQVSGQTFTAAIQTIPARTQQSFDNIVGSLFGRTLDNGSFGPIRFQTSGAIIVSSSVNNYNACGNGSVSGQWLPGLDATAALKSGTLVQLAASVDLSAGYRTNVVFTNPGSSDANVRAKVRRGDGTLVSDATIPTLGPNGFLQIGNWGPPFSGVAGTNDTNLWVEFTSDQPVLSFASVINNASGDPFAIVMTAEPVAPPAAPVANYTVSASPQPNQPVTFTDLSTGTPTNRFWVFGDGAFATNPAAPVQHTYTAAGTYKSALFVDNAVGASSKTQDVVVAAAAPIAVTISATTTNNTKWTFVCQSPASVCSGAGNNNVNLKVGQLYEITFTTPQSEGKTHGVFPVSVLNFPGCAVIRSSQPCTVNFTPTTAMLSPGFGGPTYTYFCSQDQCGTAPQHQNMSGTLTMVP